MTENLDFSTYRQTIPSIYKPIPVELLCDLLEINSEWQIKNMNADTILSSYLSQQSNYSVFADNRQRTHISKEGFIIWVLGLDYKILKEEKQPLFLHYKSNLLKYFFQNTIEREEQIMLKVEKETRIKVLEEKLNDNEDYLELMELRASVARIGKTMKSIDTNMSSQLSLFSSFETKKLQE